MMDCFAKPGAAAVPIAAVAAADFKTWLASQDAAVKAWIDANDFAPKAGKYLAVPGAKGGLALVVLGRGDKASMWDFGDLPKALPAGRYRLEGMDGADDGDQATAAALAWALGSYQFNRYKAGGEAKAKLVWPAAADRAKAEREAKGVYLCRDLINTPTNDMGPADLADAAKELARAFKAKFKVIEGDQLLKKNYPAIHAVGRASDRAPRLIDFTWGPAKAPKVTLVGKGVCFDTGGLDIKGPAGMKFMKKDMGGAAHVLGIASVLMAAKANIRLRVMIPAVENSISGNSMRPMDILPTRRGTTVEVANTDAEGRLILADALWEAVAEEPELLIDFATLTGAARVALGTDLPALFCNDDTLAADILAAGDGVEDPLWRMPLWDGYRPMVEGSQADLTNAPEGGYAGAITAALFLEHFATPEKGKPIPWAHVDLMAWNRSGKPGRPMGGEAMGLRAMAAMILTRFQSGPVKPAAAKPRRPRRVVTPARPAKPARKAR
ncbi:MAG: leucyl aminopeptidase [Rhodospirillaceae bacterium]|nr:leucyl aminopeptidase [Rhodospirillaceae bacterium]